MQIRSSIVLGECVSSKVDAHVVNYDGMLHVDQDTAADDILMVDPTSNNYSSASVSR